MNKKVFNPEKYGMVTSPSCDSRGFIQDPKRQYSSECRTFDALVAGPNEFNTRTLTEFRRRNFLWNGELLY